MASPAAASNSTITSTAVVSPSITHVSVPTSFTSLVTSYTTLNASSGSPTVSSSISSEIISTVSLSASTVYVTPSFSPNVTQITSIITQTPSGFGSSQTPQVVTVTSTYSNPTPSSTTSSAPTSSSSSASQLTADGASSGGSGLSSGGTIAIAVIIPVVVIAAAIMLGLFFWRRKRDRQSEAELRKNEMAEYGFNPNSDPGLVPGGAAYVDNKSDGDGDGYRGWGQTSTRKASTTLGSGGRPAAGLSDTTSQPGNYGYQGSPTGTGHASIDPLVHGHGEGVDAIGVLGAAGVAAGVSRQKSQNAGGLRRGPSNASSTYSAGPMSETSSDAHHSTGLYYQEEVPYNIYTDTSSQYGPYAETNPYTNQPIIRDVQARRNTRIERAPTFPQTQGGISQNF